MRSMVEACGAGASGESVAPPTALRYAGRSPFPASRGRIIRLVIASVSEAIHGRLRGKLECFVAAAPRNDER
jgi:hypothetical protein